MANVRLPVHDNVTCSPSRSVRRGVLNLDEIEALACFPRNLYDKPRAMAALWAAAMVKIDLPADASNEDPWLLLADSNYELHLTGPMSRVGALNSEFTIVASVGPSTNEARIAGRILQHDVEGRNG